MAFKYVIAIHPPEALRRWRRRAVMAVAGVAALFAGAGLHRRWSAAGRLEAAITLDRLQAPPMCPTTRAHMAQLCARQGQHAPRVQGLFVTVGPRRDTPAVLAQCVPAFDASFLGRYADEKTMAELARDCKVFFSPQKPDPQGHDTVDRSGGVFVLDARGGLSLTLRPGSTVDAIAADVGRLPGM